MPETNAKKQQFIGLLHELFQLDEPELDFGFYRIMHAKSGQVKRFIDEELATYIDEVFAGRGNQAAEEKVAQARQAILDNVDANAFEHGKLKLEHHDTPAGRRFLEAQKELREGGALSDDAQVYDHLYRFFSRYYDQGDFLSTRYRQAPSDTRDSPYSVPYDGRELYLHWANKDQYYIKSSETLRNYRFGLNAAVRQPGVEAGQGNQSGFDFGADDTPRYVQFRIVDAAEGAHGNVKQNEQRFFIIHAAKPVQLDGDILTIQFEYCPDLEKPSGAKDWQKKRLAEAEGAVFEALETLGEPATAFKQALQTPAPTEKNEGRSLLAKHFAKYAARHTMDYFIHKDLGGFLRRELDFYVKNEVMRLDHIESAEAPAVADYLDKVKVIRRIARRIIEFLAQIEEFQKKLWLKTKFVTETNYCITLDRIPEDFYPEIAANEQQIAEWERLYSISEMEGYAEPLNKNFLHKYPYLVLDTGLFDASFKDEVLSKLVSLERACDGVLLNSDNFQALGVLQRKFERRIPAIYIDPPYNTTYSKILYKNNYEHSSWLSLIANGLERVKSIASSEYSFGAAIDDYEHDKLSLLLRSVFVDSQLSTIVVNHHPQGSGGRLSRTHEYYLLLSNADLPNYSGEPIADGTEERSFMRSGRGENNWRLHRWQSFYALLLDPKTNEFVGIENPIPLGEEYPKDETEEGYKRIYPINSREEERVWRSSYITGRERIANGEIFLTERGAVKQRISHSSKRETLFSNWTDSKFNAGTNGTDILDQMGLAEYFDYPKSLYTMITGLWAQTFGRSDSIILDYFGGSGTTAHAVIEMNRGDEGNRKYILADNGEHFEAALKSRVQKAVYSKNWKDSKPKPGPDGGYQGVSHCFKYLRLESYEDALNNLALHEDADRNAALEEDAELRHDYMLRYWLDAETRGSQSLLNVEHFREPTDYRMLIKQPGSDESREQPVDLIETFNWLIGLHVELLDKPRTFAAKFEREADPDLPEGAPTRLRVKGRLKEREDGAHWFRTVEGWVARTPGSTEDVDKVLVIWRKLTDDPESDSAALESLLANQLRINQRDTEFDAIYVNGPHGLSTDFEGKHRLHSLEEAFHAAMWAVD